MPLTSGEDQKEPLLLRKPFKQISAAAAPVLLPAQGVSFSENSKPVSLLFHAETCWRFYSQNNLIREINKGNFSLDYHQM